MIGSPVRASIIHIAPTSDSLPLSAPSVAPSLPAPSDEEVDHLIPVEVLLELHRQCPELDVSTALDRFVNAVAHAARPVTTRPQVHRPHHPTLGRMIWVDCLHTDGPGLAALGNHEAAMAVTSEAVHALQDGTGLFNHGYRVDSGTTNGVHWARGQGWALYGLVGLLAYKPPKAGPLRESSDRLLTALGTRN